MVLNAMFFADKDRRATGSGDAVEFQRLRSLPSASLAERFTLKASALGAAIRERL